MLEFREITLNDREWIHKTFWQAAEHGAEYSFANQYFWGDQRLCDGYDVPLILSRFGSWTAYLYPCDPKYIEILRLDAQERGIPLRFWGVSKDELSHFGENFTVKASRNSFDYVYDINRLCDLSGKKLQSKRNHCNRFAENHPNYRVVPLTAENLPRCREFTENWYREHAHLHDDSEYEGERRAIYKAFADFEALHMEGIALETEEGLVGFSMGNRIREDMFDVNYEKALAAVNGAYPTVNREFARYLRAKYPEIRFLNREDDMGIEGLRRAKESYHPDILLEKYVVEETA